MRRQRSPDKKSTNNNRNIINIDDDDDNDEQDDDSCLLISPKNSSQQQKKKIISIPPPAATIRLPTPNQTIHQVQQQQQRVSTNLFFNRIPVDPKSPSRGWIIHAKLPPHLQISDRDKGFNHLLKNKIPKEHGQVLMMGKMIDVPRFQRAYLADYVFTGSMHRANEDTDPLDPVCKELMDWCNEQLHHQQKQKKNQNNDNDDDDNDEQPQGWLPSNDDFKLVIKRQSNNNNSNQKKYFFISALLNWYLDGEHYIGPHSDDETCMHELSPVFSLSLGQTRTFRIRDKFTNEAIKDIELRHLDFVVMGGAMQRFYKHEIVKVTGTKAKILFGPRVNVTFRCFTNPKINTKTQKDDEEKEV